MASRFVLPVLGAFLFLMPAEGQVTGGVGFNRPPAGVDETLRARILEFYTLEQEGRFRQAEGLVCEESRDRYYDMEKRRWSSVEVVQTSYEEGFSKAVATMALGTTLNTLQGPIPVKAPLTSIWRLEKGVWCRHIPEPSKDGIVTPFGIMKPAPAQGGSATPFGGGVPPPIPTDAKQLEEMVRVSRTAVALPVSGGMETVEIFNGMPGQVELQLACPPVPGLQCELSSSVVPRSGKAALTLKYSPVEGKAPPPSAETRLVVEPLGSVKSIRLSFRH